MNATAAAVASSADARSTSKRLVIAVSVLGLLAAAGARFALAWAHVTPDYFPDEYRYAAIARSLATLHSPQIRGQAAHFPALLQPLLTAPAWRVGNLETGLRIVQAIGSLTFTLAAVPAFLLARRLRLSRGAALAVAAITLLVPDGLYAGFVLSEPIAYPTALAALAVGVDARARPRRRAQIAFVVLATLATAARVQFVALPLCYLAASLVVGARERAFRRSLREQRVVWGLLVLAALGVLARGPSRALGFYGGVLHVHIHPLAALSPLGRNLLVLAYASGWVLVPGALLGLGLALARPRSRTELAFGALAGATTAALLLEATFLGETEFTQERYVFYLAPLLALSFCLYASRGWPFRRAHALLAVGMLLVAGLVPLSPYAQDRVAGHSPFLIGVEWIEWKLGNGDASLAIALVAGALALLAAAAPLRAQLGTAAVLGAAIAFCGTSYAAAWAFDRANTAATLVRYVPANRAWVDQAGVGPVTLVTASGGSPVAEESQLFWNRSLDRAARLPGGAPPDDRTADPIRVTTDGTLRLPDGPVRGSLLVDGHGSTVVFRDAVPVAAAKNFTLWRPRGPAHLALYMAGRSSDGWFASRGAITLWPRSGAGGVHGLLELTLRAPRSGTVSLTLRRGDFKRTFTAGPGRPAQVQVPACTGSGPWSIGFQAPVHSRVGGRLVAGRVGMPRLVASARVCPAS